MKINKIWLIAFAYCLLPISFALSLTLFVRRQPDIGQPQENTQTWIYSGHQVTQSFTPRNNGLNIITIYLKNVSLRNRDPFLFQLSDANGILRTIRINGYNIGDGDNVRFQFDPVADSGNKQFTLTLSSESPKELAVGVGFSEVAESIAFQTYYFPTSRINGVISNTIEFTRSLFQPVLIIFFFTTGLFAFLFAKKLFNTLL